MKSPPQLAVTVAITRRADPSRAAEMAAWVRAGASLAEAFPGFLGTGWVRPELGSTEWHMLYRFADAGALHGWEESPERQWWLSSAEGFVEHTRVEKRTGIEGWFDPPRELPADEGLPEAPKPPARWKQAVTIWLGFFPVSLLSGWLLAPHLVDLNLVLRTMISTLVLTPIMTYLVLPRVTRALQPWLKR
ncbi:antibiotic biosynthesis monooxygenase [Actinoplanes awajinensis]|uniref:Antibiotic biosynthesis monooxygenase n=1 Tax=Actinoplanes awajinensis subsp. mycoplanecinus TaxID=135947 RepID=A0A0X3V9A7_9ACTN|nr:antibiotic biosynthesis monooxygenase [Actinoplanes awajinensis]KUL40832.1 antibiotic biosynthesis monooxygenase [Actinoplanes awajinensis subsp. mycoplanecinus]